MRNPLALLITCAALAAPAARGQLATTLNDNSTTPAAPAGTRLIVPLNDGGRPVVNVSHYVIYPTIQVTCPASGDLSAHVAAAVAAATTANGGIVDARACTAATTWTTAVTITRPNVALLLPCAPLAATQPLTVAAGIRNTTIRGCTYLGTQAGSGASGGTVWVWNGTGPAFIVGDPTYAVDTPGFSMENMAINAAGASSGASAFYFYRTQEVNLQNLYLLGDNSTDETGMTLDGTGNYSGGSFINLHINGFGTAALLTGHVSGSVSDDYANASTFSKIHIDCPTSGGNPISGTYGWNVAGGDGNTWTGGDVESCSTMFHFGAAATGNTVVGVRNENSTLQIVADAGSSYNSWVSGATIFTGRITDAGTQNSFVDAFHRDWNQVNGDRYASLIDATLTNHFRLGTGQGNERGLENEVETDYGERWLYGLTDGTAGNQSYQVEDLLNDAQRLVISQYLSATANTVTNVRVNNGGKYSTSTPPTIGFSGGGGTGAAATATMFLSPTTGLYEVTTVTMTNNGSGYTSQPTLTWSGSNQIQAPSAVAEITTAGSTNNQTALNSAGTGAVVLNGGANSGTGGVVIGSGGATPAQVWDVDNSGNVYQAGNLLFQNPGGLYWELEGDTSSVFAIHDAASTIPANVFRAFPNAGTEVDSQATSAVVINNTSTGGTGGLTVYAGGSNSNVVVFRAAPNGSSPAVIQMPGQAAGSGHACLHADTSGYITPTSFDCGSGSGSGSVTGVGLSAPADVTVSNSPITTSGNIGFAWANGTGPALAATATAPATTPTPCSGGQFSLGDLATFEPDCATVPYASVSGTPAALPPNGTASGDLSGSYPGPTVANIEGGAIPASVNVAGWNASHQPAAAPNTLGCLDGYDHLPCTVYIQSPLSESSPTASYATVYTTTAAGIYRVSGYIYGTTASSTSYSVEQFVKAQQTGQSAGNGYLQSEAQIGTTISSDPWYSYTFPLSSSIPIQTESVTANGTNTSGVWSRALIVERIQ